MTDWVNYCGRNVPKENFRAFVYGKNEEQLLVNSWDEYLNAISSGLWFPTKNALEEVPKKRKA